LCIAESSHQDSLPEASLQIVASDTYLVTRGYTGMMKAAIVEGWGNAQLAFTAWHTSVLMIPSQHAAKTGAAIVSVIAVHTTPPLILYCLLVIRAAIAN